MIKITVELWPKGKEENKRLLGEAIIANIGGEQDRCDYVVTLFKSPEYAKNPGVWKKGNITKFPRLLLGPWDLLYRALRQTVGDRNQ